MMIRMNTGADNGGKIIAGTTEGDNQRIRRVRVSIIDGEVIGGGS
jgi:hypothetical protein